MTERPDIEYVAGEIATYLDQIEDALAKSGLPIYQQQGRLVRPIDNAVIAIGLLRYGYKTEAQAISQSVLRAMLSFDDPVELYTVQPSRWVRSHHIEQEWFLADYFYACGVQAWTAAAILYMTSMLLYQ